MQYQAHGKIFYLMIIILTQHYSVTAMKSLEGVLKVVGGACQHVRSVYEHVVSSQAPRHSKKPLDPRACAIDDCEFPDDEGGNGTTPSSVANVGPASLRVAPKVNLTTPQQPQPQQVRPQDTWREAIAMDFLKHLSYASLLAYSDRYDNEKHVAPWLGKSGLSLEEGYAHHNLPPAIFFIIKKKMPEIRKLLNRVTLIDVQEQLLSLATLILHFLFIVQIDVTTWSITQKNADKALRNHVLGVYNKFKECLVQLLQRHLIGFGPIQFREVFLRLNDWFMSDKSFFPYPWVQNAFAVPTSPFGDFKFNLSGQAMLDFFKSTIIIQSGLKAIVFDHCQRWTMSFHDFLICPNEFGKKWTYKIEYTCRVLNL